MDPSGRGGRGAAVSEPGATHWDDVVEPHVRRVVAEVLGVEPGEIGPAVSLVDDLAADSLDLVDIGLALEAALGVSMPDEVLEGVRTYDDLLAAVCREPVETAAFVRARVEPTFLTETLTQNAHEAGAGARGDAGGLSSADIVAALERTFGRLRTLGAAVSVAREQGPPRPPRSG